MTKGGRNLIFLGLGSIIFTLIMTAISLFIYHNSGDIYLDRSRPGFLPDKTEATEEEEINNNYTFSDFGAIDKEVLEEYLQELQKNVDEITKLSNPYSSAPLSDESLGIPKDSSQP